VTDLVAAGWSQRAALVLAGVPRSSWHYRRYGRRGAGVTVAHTARTSRTWLTAQEREAIEAHLAGRQDGVSVYTAFHHALDAGAPVASLSSWHRVERSRRRGPAPVVRRQRPPAAMPCLSATAPMQVWTWDLTELPGPYRGVSYHLYVVLDLFSRMIVAWRLEDREDDQRAKQMFQNAFADHHAHPLVVHSDRGSSMMSTALADLYNDLGISRSRNRPGVSNDNPHSEAGHKTLKYWRGAPHRFDSLEHAREWAAQVIPAYNTTHHHRGLEGHTPASVHNGTWKDIHTTRQAALDRLYSNNPARYTKPPVAKTPFATVGINTKTTKERLTTG
jgi:putative transposase